jgi:septal ring-binding cell division protein DamX
MSATFNEPSMQERVELIVHLLRFSDRLFTIMSDDTNALSSFSHMLLRHDATGLHYAEVYPTPGMDAEDIVMNLARAWGIEVDFGETAMNALFQRLAPKLPDPQRAVAIIHFAERLPPMILDGLIAFMQRLDQINDGRVRMILMGTPVLTQRIAPMQTLSEAGQVYALHLQPLTSSRQNDEQPSLATQAFVSNEPMNSAENAHGVTTERAAKVLAQSPATKTRSLFIVGLGASLILAVIVALMLRPKAPEVPKETTVSIPLTPQAAPDVSSEPMNTATAPAVETTATTPTVASSPSPEVAAKKLPPTQASATLPSVYAPMPTTASAAMPTEQVTPTPPPVASTSPQPAKREAATLPKHEAKNTPKPERSKSEQVSGDVYSTQNAQQYVVQIISLGSANAVNTFITTHGLHDCQYFTQKRGDKTLYSLSCGLYPSRDAALAAVAKLPEKVRSAAPYPRQIADIRKVMLP